MYVVIGVPVFAIVMAMVVSMFQFSALDLRITRFETALNARLTSLENRVQHSGNTPETLTRVEALLERH